MEYNLIKDELHQIDKQLEKAENELTWNSDGIWDYMEQLRKLVIDLDHRVKRTQHNVEVISKSMQTWKDKPMFTRKESESIKKVELFDFEGNSNRNLQNIL